MTRFFQPDRLLKVPDERSGLLFVFRVFDRVSYAILLNTTDPVVVGDYVRNPCSVLPRRGVAATA